MEKQKVCIIGGGLTGLTAALILGKLNLNVELVIDNFNNNSKNQRTTAFSESNYFFLKKHHIFKSSNYDLWPCKDMELYDEDHDKKIFSFSSKNKKNILYMGSNNNLSKIILEKIKKNKNIKIKKNTKVLKLFSDQNLKFIKNSKKKISKYNLVIVCTGMKSILAKNFLDNKYFQYDYKEVAITSVITHNKTKNNVVRQFFLKEGPLALLPISNKKTSIVWSIKKNFFKKYENQKDSSLNFFLKNIIKNIYSNIKFESKFEYSDLFLHISHKYFEDRVLILGDALHTAHPFVGQGFNMILRDLIKLEKILKEQLNLGSDVGNYSVLNKFEKITKPNNAIYLTGIEIIKKFFSNNSKTFKGVRNYYFKKMNNNILFKNFFTNLADKGINL
jgi:2-octaprenyl-6-methoxyphenol hydroxylase